MAKYEVGYAKPPKHSRFKAGVSGNPRGRPKREASTIGEIIDRVKHDALREELDALVWDRLEQHEGVAVGK